ncbi:MAG: S41 family peptidase [Candidatus Paceibacterota bacterium]|jgi:carboxyl-terminal processing protease
MNKNKLIFGKFLVIFSVIILISFGVGVYFGSSFISKTNEKIVFVSNSTNSDTSTSSVNLKPFWDAWKILDNKFVPTVKASKVIDNQEKVWGAIKGLASQYGDPYTVFMPPEDSKMFESDISGNFEGVGMEIGMKDNQMVVVSPLKGTPAYNAGVKAGDFILSIDDVKTDSMAVDNAVKLIRGKANTQVSIKFAREGKTEPFVIKITRGIINVPTLETEKKGDIFVIKLYNFYAPASNAFRGALREFIESGTHKLILDLRGNPGGYLESAVDMSSFFLPVGKVVVSESFGGKQNDVIYRSKGYDIFNDTLRMVILVDGGSASASEILAGALKEQGVAKLVGTKTFGKGSVQELIKLTPDTSLKVTIAKWLTPKGNSISEGGLTPDYEVKFTAKDLTDKKDSQMEKAVEVVNGL